MFVSNFLNVLHNIFWLIDWISFLTFVVDILLINIKYLIEVLSKSKGAGHLWKKIFDLP